MTLQFSQQNFLSSLLPSIGILVLSATLKKNFATATPVWTSFSYGTSPNSSTSISTSSIAEAFKKHLIIPDAVDIAPKSMLGVQFGQLRADLGNELTPTQTKEFPKFSYKANMKKFYVLSMTDAGWIMSQSEKEEYTFPGLGPRDYFHCLIGNIPGSAVLKGEVLIGYQGSAPPSGQKPHRYVWLLYEQPEKLYFDEKHVRNCSTHYRLVENLTIRSFAKKYNLGRPIAGNFYHAQNDDSVGTIWNQMVTCQSWNEADLTEMQNYKWSKTMLPKSYAVSIPNFENMLVVPDVIDKVPSSVLSVRYGQLKVIPGIKLTPTQVHNVPAISWDASPDKFYVLCMTDALQIEDDEGPTRPWEYIHYLVGNIQGSNPANADVLYEYAGAAPPEVHKEHRYVFLLYQYQWKINFDEERVRNCSYFNRGGRFTMSKFAKKYRLGRPIAGNFYLAKYDDNVGDYWRELSQCFPRPPQFTKWNSNYRKK